LAVFEDEDDDEPLISHFLLAHIYQTRERGGTYLWCAPRIAIFADVSPIYGRDGQRIGRQWAIRSWQRWSAEGSQNG